MSRSGPVTSTVQSEEQRAKSKEQRAKRKAPRRLLLFALCPCPLPFALGLFLNAFKKLLDTRNLRAYSLVLVVERVQVQGRNSHGDRNYHLHLSGLPGH